MKVLVTGATGFTGSHLVKKLLSSGYAVRALARDKEKAKILGKHPMLEVAYGDLKDKDFIYSAVKGTERVFHIAALFREAKYPDSEYWKINVHATKDLLDAALAHQVSKFVHCSTIGVLGDIKEAPADELTPYNPGDIYQTTKMEGEKTALMYGKEKGLDVSVVRPCAIYGPGDMRLYKVFKGIQKKRFLIVGKGNIFYHPVYIDNLVQGFMLAAQKKSAAGHVFIIGDERYYSLNDFLKIIADELQSPYPKIKIPAKPVQVLSSLIEKTFISMKKEPPIYRRRVDFFTKSRAFKIDKAKELLDYRPEVDFPTGVHHTAQWYRDNGLLS
jgi:nucleoside-diphosphate-sugar epimerase